MSDAAVIQANSISKAYGGRSALNGLTFSVPRGSICGFLGPNGAGKTTTLRILMGLARPDQGGATVLGMPCDIEESSIEIRKRTAFVPEVKELFSFATAEEMIRLTRGFYPDWDRALEARLIRDFEIPLPVNCRKLSKGTRTKLMLLLALCRRPELLLLDEPSEGLDPLGAEDLMRLLVEQVAEREATVFFSTHQLGEVEQIADRVVMLNRGRNVLEGSLDELKQRYLRVRCVAQEEAGPLPAGLAHWRREGRILTGFSTEDPRTLTQQLAPSGIAVLESQPATLKELFFEQMGR
jgi:ABC-2 type transport system ATP-binding protein